MRRLSTILACSSLAGLLLAGTAVAAQAQQVPRIRAAQGITVSPSPAEFGTVIDGRRPKQLDVIIGNFGPDPVDLGNVSISEDIDFSGGGGGCQFSTLAPKTGCKTTVTFTPTGSGDRSATLYFMSQDGLTIVAAVPLHGVARPCHRMC